MNTYNFHVYKDFISDGYRLYVSRINTLKDGGPVFHKDCISDGGWIPVNEGAACPSILVKTEDLIVLADTLWQNKIKPPEFFNSIGEQDATKKHLEDMREIAFHKLGIGSRGHR